jgi:hypothetical protein
VRVCKKHAERLKLSVVAEFSDAAISGGTPQRPDYQRMLADARLLDNLAPPRWPERPLAK